MADIPITATAIHLGQRTSSHAAAIAAAIHMIWKYLFMSNSTALTTTRFGTRNSAISQAAMKPRAGSASRPRNAPRATIAMSTGMPRLVT